MRQDETISRGSFTVRRADVMATMEEQRSVGTQLADHAIGPWRKLKWISIIAILLMVVVMVVADRMPNLQVDSQFWTTIGFVMLAVFGLLYKFSSWKLQRALHRLDGAGSVKAKTLAKALEKRIFKGRDSVRGEARFSETGFELVQDGVKFSADYDDEIRIGFISERNGFVQITPGDARNLPDVIFFIPLANMSEPQALLEQVKRSSSFIFTYV